MAIPIKLDERYKVNQHIVDKMRLARKTGESYNKIAKRFGVSYHTAYYWINENYRIKKQKINSKRVRKNITEEKKRIKQLVEARRKHWKQYPISYVIDAVTSAKNEKRSKRFRVLGKPIDEWDKILAKYKTGGQKIK
jgi:transposase